MDKMDPRSSHEATEPSNGNENGSTKMPERLADGSSDIPGQNTPESQLGNSTHEEDSDEVSEVSTRQSHDMPKNEFFSARDAPPPEEPHTPRLGASLEHSVAHGGKEDPEAQAIEPARTSSEESRPQNDGRANPDPDEMARTEVPAGSIPQEARRSSTMPSMVFVATALENIASSKESRKRKGLGDSVQAALAAIKEDRVINPEIIFEPLRLATETLSIPLTTVSLDCIGKLITYSYFSIPSVPQQPTAAPESPQVPLIERAIDTICDCFQDEATPPEVQLQIVKSLLAAVLNDKIIVHGAGLLKAVRQVYNIFLLSKSVPNQQVAQGTLSQMVGTVFERVKLRLAQKEARLNLNRLGSGRDTANGSQVDLAGNVVAPGSRENEIENEGDGSSEGASTLTSDLPSHEEPREKMTLKSFENTKSLFDDTRIGDNAPTMVTRASLVQKSRRTASGQNLPGDDDQDFAEEEDEDEIFIKDAFLVFRSMCRLSTKILAQEQLQDLRSQNMRSKLISLSIIRTLMNNNTEVFTSPLITIRGSSNSDPTSFGQAVNQYLRLAVSRNGASSVKPVFETSCEIFWLMVKDMRVILKVRHQSVL